MAVACEQWSWSSHCLELTRPRRLPSTHVYTEECSRLSKHFMCAKHSCDHGCTYNILLVVSTNTILYTYACTYVLHCVLLESCSYTLTNMNTIASYIYFAQWLQTRSNVQRPPTTGQGWKTPGGLTSLGSLNMTML